MSIDELARASATDLRRAVDRGVDPEQARLRLGSRVRARRLEHALIAVVLALVAVVGASTLYELDRAAMPAAPTVDPQAAPAADCLFTECRPGPRRAALAIPMTFESSDSVTIRSDTPGRLEMSDLSGTFAMTVLADPRAVNAADSSTAAADLAAWIAGRDDLAVTPVRTSVLAGRAASVVDVLPRQTGSDSTCSDGCLLLAARTNGSAGDAVLGVAAGETLRVFLLDVPGNGTVAVAVSDRSTSGYAPAVALGLLGPVLDSLRFGSA